MDTLQNIVIPIIDSGAYLDPLNKCEFATEYTCQYPHSSIDPNNCLDTATQRIK